MKEISNKPLSAVEAKLASRLLSLARDKFSNHGCSDFQLNLPEKEAREILVARERWNGDEAETVVLQTQPICNNDSDWYMMAYLAARLEAFYEKSLDKD